MRHNFVDDAQARLVTAAAVSGSDAVITIALSDSQFWVLDWISYSYATAPTAGKLTVTIGGVLVYDVDITAAGSGHINFDWPLYQEAFGKAMVVTLANGTAAKKLNIRYR